MLAAAMGALVSRRTTEDIPSSAEAEAVKPVVLGLSGLLNGAANKKPTAAELSAERRTNLLERRVRSLVDGLLSPDAAVRAKSLTGLTGMVADGQGGEGKGVMLAIAHVGGVRTLSSLLLLATGEEANPTKAYVLLAALATLTDQGSTFVREVWWNG